MKSYLELVKNYEKVHRKRNRITIICIVIAVSLVTAIFGMAEMEAKAQRIREINENGNWHFAIKNLDEGKIAQMLESYGNLIEVSGYILGFSSDVKWKYGDSEFRITGGDGVMLEQLGLCIEDGVYPSDETEIMVDADTAKLLNLQVGERMKMTVREGEEYEFTLTGICTSTAVMQKMGMKGVIMNPLLASKLYDSSVYRKTYYVQFKPSLSMRQHIDEIKANIGYADEDISENTALLALSGQSRDSYMMQLYGVACVLFVMVLVAGVLMISGTFNTNVEERTQFFGMLRCLGATKKQIRKYVLYESIRYLRVALPIGVVVGTLTYWAACAYLKFYNYEFFSELPMLGFSSASLIGGIAVGFCTVLFAALAPCRRASRVSPLSAVTANQYSSKVKFKKSAKTGLVHVEDALGIHHASSNKKSLLLMTGSFGISIVLFMSFSVIVSFMNHAIVPLEKWTPDLELSTSDSQNTLSGSRIEELLKIDGVNKAYGRKFAEGTVTLTPTNQLITLAEDDITAIGGDQKLTLLTYESNQFKWAKKYLVDGSIDEVASGAEKVIVAYNMSYPYQVGQKVPLSINGVTKEVEIGAIVNKTPFKVNDGESVMITSESFFDTFVIADGYAVIDVQLDRTKSDAVVEEVRRISDDVGVFSDSRLSNAQAKAANGSFAIFIYGFLAIIALITVFNIINSMNMSINARLGQYGVMHAVGMSVSQIKRMVFLEAATYAVIGSVLGCIFGLLLNRMLFKMMVTFRWGTPWSIPVVPMIVICVLVIGSTILSVLGPIRKCKSFSLMNTGI